MTRRVITAREQHEMLSPWRVATTPELSVKKYVKTLHDEMKQWARGAHEDDFSGDPSNPAYNWEDIEGFLKNRYPAAHRGIELGMEDARPLVHGEASSFDAPYESGPEAEGKYGYDPHLVAAAMVLLHNKADGGREWAIPEDMSLLTKVFIKRQQMQRNYEQRQTTAMAEPAEAWDTGHVPYFPMSPDNSHDMGNISRHLNEGWNGEPKSYRSPYFYHATNAELQPGDALLPRSQTGESSKYGWGDVKGMESRDNFVWMWPSRSKAISYAGPRGVLDDTPAYKYVYKVKPDDQPMPWNGSGKDGHVANSATVVELVHRND